MTKKYELINRLPNGLYQIKALKSFSHVTKGDLGGFVAKEANLSHNGNCWVYDNANVYDNAKVYDNANVYDNAKVFDNAKVSKTSLNIFNKELYQYNITLTDFHIQIGCMQMLYTEWLLVGKKDAKLMGLDSNKYDNVKKLLQTIIPQYYRE